MFPCFFKKYIGIDCPGCGVQRAIKALLEGNIEQSLVYYPMLIPLLGMFAYLAFHIKFKFFHGHKVLLILFIANTIGIVITYLLKILSGAIEGNFRLLHS